MIGGDPPGEPLAEIAADRVVALAAPRDAIPLLPPAASVYDEAQDRPTSESRSGSRGWNGG
jgi:hypothetical protein